MRGDNEKLVLVVEDEPDVRRLVCYSLKKAGFRVTEAPDGLSGLRAGRQERPDAIILDLMLPEMRGEEVCRQLKADASTAGIPVIMLTAKAQPEERIAGLELGADDYVAKPFSPRELILRVQAVLRRLRAASPEGVVSAGGLEFDRANLEIRRDGQRLDLTAIEFKLLATLMEKRGRVLTRDNLLRGVWGYRGSVDTRTVDTHMRRLRQKLGACASDIETVRGEGYRFVGVAG